MRLWFFIFFLGLIGCESEAPIVHVRGQTMGTTFQVSIAHSGGTLNMPVLAVEINDLLDEVNRQMSTYRKDSEITAFNQTQSTDWVGVSSDFQYVLNVAQQISAWSNGAFDVTVGPLVNLWGFGPEAVPERIPPADSIAVAKTLTGYEKIEMREHPVAIRKRQVGMYCDLSAVAKGFGVDKVAGHLDSLNLAHYYVEIGGEVRVKGRNAEGDLWRIGIASPESNGIQKVVALDNVSMATSGDYHNYFEKDGVRYSHTIDPRTGRPITHRLVSVSVIHQSCTWADGLATAINVMGPDSGYVFALERDLPVLMIVKEDAGFVEKMTPAFEKLFRKVED